jgi:hypothetical protein
MIQPAVRLTGSQWLPPYVAQGGLAVRYDGH